MELDAVTAFLVLAEELHFGHAAERMNMSRSSLSRQMQGLERTFGTPLVARTSRIVTLTPAGKVLAAGAPAVVSAIEGLAADVRSASQDRT